ncbi:hypothetical protein NQ317_010228 [Molorchus minor]|uniref:Sensory neuron membrane protein 2 n=1 Tax=Molorchus minor TaxID=1323400 RepID=A0ABQ9J413_9CUCU|nr:hypothetical protein NQ317_010228 [Molorchus minor]
MLLWMPIHPKSVQLQKGTIQWDRFVEIPFELDFKVWLFDITNPEDIMNGAKPVLKEVGPYAYKEKKKRNILDTDDTDDTVIYEQELSLEFDESLSGDLKEDDELTLLNPVLLSMSQETNVIERMVLGGCLERIFPPEYNTLFIKIKVRTVLFEGFEFAINSDDVGVACGIVRKKILDKTLKARNIEQIKNGTDENEITSLRFSLLNYRINQPDGMYGVNRGLRDVSQLGNIMRWNNDTKLPFWGRMESINNDTCNKVRGTDSTIYPPYITNDQSLEIFSTDICR